ncbi:MAG: PD-(D/E)XK nuclease domain-containing protein [Paraprevotella sp.]|nr:PD-(D/E)XK nuclease domain-containing protein [Paraprevotella sp.]
MDQIEEKGYADTFAGDNRKTFKIGINFDSETKKINDWKIR